MKRALQIVGLANELVLSSWLAPLAAAQERVSQDGNGKEIDGNADCGEEPASESGYGFGGGARRAAQSMTITYMRSRFGRGAHSNQYKIRAYVRGDTAWVVGEWEGGRRPRHFSGEFAVNVPREMALVKLETEGGNVDATGLAGHVDAESGGGSMQFDDIGGGANAETGGGSIDVGTVSGDLGLHTGGGSIEVRHANGKVVAETGGGSVEIRSGAQGATVETGGGSVEVRQCNGKVKVSTGGGSVDLSEIGGPAEIETGGGSIRLTSAKGHVRAETGGGGIELSGVPSAYAETGAGGITVKLMNTGGERHDSDLETGAGDITVYIASDVAVNVRASVDMGNGHRITSDFPEIHIASEGDHWGPKTLTAEGKLNGGGPTVKIHTSTGDICIRKTR